ncbi:phospholipase B-like 1 [Monodelphis domestica]|uniref:Phospholipase B-like n=1 Tax=Monodelphis domestica TaxID=13616 RepID=F7B6W0_MONDO|nr:phospholipase B-like 1 [Monodelphis domestica]
MENQGGAERELLKLLPQREAPETSKRRQRGGSPNAAMTRFSCFGRLQLWPLQVLLLLLLTFGAPVTQAGIHYATVYWNSSTSSAEVKDSLDPDGDAYGFYNDTIQTTGWGILEIRAGYGANSLTDEIIMFVAGFLEGYLTAQHMYYHYENLYPQLIKKPDASKKVQDFLAKQDDWAREQVGKNKKSPFWRHIGYILSQLDGLYFGAAQRAKAAQRKPLTVFQVQFLNAIGDTLDLLPSLMVPGNVSLDHSEVDEMGHCSVLIKVLPGFENILFSHSSWFSYASTLRIYKHWDFSIKDPMTKSSRHSFSSYPGFLESLDDFYILSSGLVLLQTTNTVFNITLLKQVIPESLLAWQRVRAANMMADGGKKWANIFSRYNSGTYNNQYMVLDLKKVKLNESLGNETLFIVEQIPKLVEFSDQTDILRKGYWASYNIPFHKTTYNLSGYPMLVEKLGLDYSYDLAPRAKIFRRDQGQVTDIKSMKKIMRYNNYKKDPYSRGNPCNTICCREDLNSKRPVPAGCYDTKVADMFLASQFTAYAINGPTVDDGLPVFEWKKFNETIHKGLPEAYNFDFVTMKPLLEFCELHKEKKKRCGKQVRRWKRRN